MHSPSLPLEDINSSKFGIGHPDSGFPLEKSGEEASMPALLSEQEHRDYTFREIPREQEAEKGFREMPSPLSVLNARNTYIF